MGDGKSAADIQVSCSPDAEIFAGFAAYLTLRHGRHAMPDVHMPGSDVWSGNSGPGSPAPVIHSAQLSATLQELDNLQSACVSRTNSARFSQIQNHCDYLQSTIASIRTARQHTTENVIESTAESARAQVNEYALVRMQGRLSRRQNKQDRAIQKVTKRAAQVENQQRYQFCRTLCTGI